VGPCSDTSGSLVVLVVVVGTKRVRAGLDIEEEVGQEMKAMGKRMPYLVLSTLLALIGFVGQIWAEAPIHPLYYFDHTYNNNETRSITGGDD